MRWDEYVTDQKFTETCESVPEAVWCVWTEWGEYEQFSRDMRGCFSTAELAERHAGQLRGERDYSEVEVICEPVLTGVPTNVPHIRWSVHIRSDGTEDRGLGYHRDVDFWTWSNEIEPVLTARLGLWSGPHKPNDLFIEVIGCDKQAVAAEYKRLLAQAREQLGK